MPKESESQAINISQDMLAVMSDEFLGEELKTITLAKIAAVQALNISTLDVERYIIAVENLESTLVTGLDATYDSDLAAAYKPTVDKGQIFVETMVGQRRLASAKFKALMRLIDRRKTDERELKT